jgi:hypothetical protein
MMACLTSRRMVVRLIPEQNEIISEQGSKNMSRKVAAVKQPRNVD